MKLRTCLYSEQLPHWPTHGKHILAQYDLESIVVYQAYSPQIADYAIKNQNFGGNGFSYDRMSWIKPNFLWMCYRSGWASKQGQQRILAIRINVEFWEEILEQAVVSSFIDGNEEEWKRRVKESNVRLQWDPDHDPLGLKQPRRAIQLGLRGEMLRRFGREEIVEIEDITEFVEQEREKLTGEGWEEVLRVPVETVYVPRSEAARRAVRLD